ncbi:MAG: hypothetical protein KAS32_00970 [Candidatus Peribacteraceae bacterium]|nr:hypothetical protein [Candidatus Peribacteraceae bacterium]
MKTVYILIKAEDEPDKSGKYISKEYDLGWHQHQYKKRERAWYDLQGFRCDVVYWLKKVELPSGDDIDAFLKNMEAEIISPISVACDVGFKEGAQFILNKLK